MHLFYFEVSCPVLDYMFLIMDLSDYVSEHKRQQMEDPYFLEPSVRQWHPSSALLILLVSAEN